MSPTFYFLLPSSKIRDVTFLFSEEGKSIIVIMSSAGHIYTQLMEEASSAQQAVDSVRPLGSSVASGAL